MASKSTHPPFGLIISLAVLVLLTGYMSAYFLVSEVGYSNYANGASMRVRDFGDRPWWLCRVYRPMAWAESQFAGDTYMSCTER